MKKTTAIKDLSFVKRNSAGRNFWSPVKPSDTPSAFSSGADLARQYLGYAIQKNSAPILSSVILDMFKNNTTTDHIARAQIIGFLSSIEAHIKATGDNQ